MPELELRNLLWSSRGKEWGFRFLHQPAWPGVRWDLVYQKIFGSDDHVPRRWHGTIVLSAGTALPYVASRFNDYGRVWKDAAGREIPHEMLLILETVSAQKLADLDWERMVMDCVRNYYQDQFDKDPASVKPLVDESTSVGLPWQRSPLPSITYNIRIDKQQAQARDSRNRFPLYEEVWRVLNMDIRVLFKMIIRRLRGGFPNGET